MRNPAPTPARVPAPPAPATALDAHGHDPAAYDWVPVLRKRRADGWSPDRQRAFIEALADCGSVAAAARSVGMSESTAYRLRRSPGAEAFDRAWAAAIDAASKKLIDAAFERALVGTDEPIFDREGRRVGRRLRQSDRLLMFLLRAYRPDRFGPVSAEPRQTPGQAAPHANIAAPTIADALVHLHPEPPAAPAALMAPDDRALAYQLADIGDGVLPHWLRDDPDADEAALSISPLGEEFETMLDRAKQAAAGQYDWDNAGEPLDAEGND